VITNQSDNGSSRSFALYLTDSSGALHRIEPFHREAFLVTGEGEASNLLRQKVRSEWFALTGENENIEREALRDNLPHRQNSAFSSDALSVNQIPNLIDLIANDQKMLYSTQEQQDNSVEAVLFSMAHGIIKLDHNHIEALRARQTMDK
jgi:hypothetical protein